MTPDEFKRLHKASGLCSEMWSECLAISQNTMKSYNMGRLAISPARAARAEKLSTYMQHAIETFLAIVEDGGIPGKPGRPRKPKTPKTETENSEN